MAKILVVDTDEKGIEEIRKAILHLNPDIKVNSYTTLNALHEEARKLKGTELEDFFKFDMMILDYMASKPAEWEAKLADLKAKNQIESTVCMTAFDDPAVNKKHIGSLKLFNIFYKPFDQLILKESINIALSSHKSVKPVEMRAQSFNSQISILKEIELLSISELGFLTLNDKAIPTGGAGKYFSGIFSHGKKQSAWAQCLMSIALPNKPGYFISKFQYVGMESGCLLSIRKFLVTNKKNNVPGSTWSLAAPTAINPVSIALIDLLDDKALAVKTDLETHFQNVTVEFIKLDPSKKTEPSEIHYDFVINLNSSLKYDDFKNRFAKDMKYFLVASEPLSDDRLKEFSEVYRDIFTMPLEKSYFYKKLKLHHKALAMKDVNEVASVSTSEKVKAANQVKISEICELYVNVTYSRELPYGTHRDFVFMNEDENQITELPAFCNFAEKVKPKAGDKTESYFHQFIFFGMTDHYLKQIRIWLLQSFIQQNKRE